MNDAPENVLVKAWLKLGRAKNTFPVFVKEKSDDDHAPLTG